MDVLFWLIIQIVVIIALIIVRLHVAVKAAERTNLNKWVTIGSYAIILIVLCIFIVLSIISKEKILYMYICSFSYIIIINFILGKFISYLNKHTTDNFKP